jgi:hypothetical protein
LKAWADWWEWPPLAASARAKVWDGLNRVRFHDVISRRPSQVAYAVVQVQWEYLDDFYTPGSEGGTVECVYRNRERAEVEAARLSASWKETFHYWHCGLHLERWESTDWPFIREKDGADDGPMYEVIEIDLGPSEGVR